MRTRRVWFWAHLITGVGSGAIIFVMSVTGALLALERQILNFADRSYRSVTAAPGQPRLPLETLLANVKAAQGSLPMTLIVRSDAGAAIEAGFGREETIYVDPYTGTILGKGSPGARAFFRKVEDWHRWLAVSAEQRVLGRRITGGATLAFFGLLSSGVILWWPKRWTAIYLRVRLWFQGELTGRTRQWNQHQVAGIWSMAPLMVIVLSGLVMSYPWANNLLYRLAGDVPPAATGGQREGAGRAGQSVSAANLNPLWDRAEQKAAGWQSITLRLPASERAPATFVIDKGNGGRPDLRAQLTLDRRTGDVVRWEPFESYTSGRRARLWARFLHTGQAGGIAGQVAAGAACLGGVMLVWTGIAMVIRRVLPGGAKRESEAPQEPQERILV